MKIPNIKSLQPDYSYAEALKSITNTGDDKEAEFDDVFPYIYYETKTQNESLPIPGIFDISPTIYVSKLEKTNTLAPRGKELVIIGPLYERTTAGSHVNRLIRCLLNPVGDNFVFTGKTNFDISFIALNHNKSTLGAYASLLLTNQLRVIEADPKSSKGTITQQILEDLKKQFLDSFGINSGEKKRVEILKAAKRLAIRVRTSEGSVKSDEDIVRIIDNNQGEAKGVSLRQIGFSAALRIYVDNLNDTTPLPDLSASQIKSYVDRSLSIDPFLSILKQNGSKNIVEHLSGL